MGGVPVTIVDSGGVPVIDVDGAEPVTSASGAVPVTLVDTGGLPVTFVTEALVRDPQGGAFGYLFGVDDTGTGFVLPPLTGIEFSYLFTGSDTGAGFIIGAI